MRVQSRDELLHAVCRLVVERGAIDLAWIGWLDPGTFHITPVSSFGGPRDLIDQSIFYADDRPEGQANPGKAIREGRSFVCAQCGVDACFYPQAPAKFGNQSCASFSFALSRPGLRRLEPLRLPTGLLPRT